MNETQLNIDSTILVQIEGQLRANLEGRVPQELFEAVVQAAVLIEHCGATWEVLKASSVGARQRRLHALVDIWGRIAQLRALLLSLTGLPSALGALGESETISRFAVLVDGSLQVAGEIMRIDTIEAGPQPIDQLRSLARTLSQMGEKLELDRRRLEGASNV